MNVTATEWAGWVTVTAKSHGWAVHESDLRGGFPSICAVQDDRVLFVYPRADGTLTKAQQEWERVLRETGADVRVWSPDDLPEVLAALSAT